MRKSEVSMLNGTLQAILSDYLGEYPVDTRCVERDIVRLSSLVRTRGLGVFLLDLPAMGKHFDFCLSRGCFTRPGLPAWGVRRKSAVMPDLFSGILVRVFEPCGRLRDDADVTCIFYLRQIFQFAKGFEYACTKTRTAEAVREFFNIEADLRQASLNWDADRIDLSAMSHYHFGDDSEPIDRMDDGKDFYRPQVGEREQMDVVLQRTCDIIAGNLGLFNPFDHSPRHGRGAVSDLTGEQSKYAFPNWSDKLEGVFPAADFAFANYGLWADSLSTIDISDLEPPSKLIAVPKTAKGPRLIASEPTSHMWCQQIILKFLVDAIERGILRNSISIKDQIPSRDLALRASLGGSHGTIDLSSASDRISTWLVERAFRANKSLLEAYHAARTRWIHNPITRDEDLPKIHNLRKFSTQGSACTFPTQSILFAMIAVATVLHKDGSKVSQRNVEKAARRVRVFGDDIIVEARYYDLVCHRLERLGLRVNPSKSHGTGLFRESCGMDAYGGVDVTPAHVNTVYEGTKPTTIVATIDASNNFFKKGLWRTADYIKSTLPGWAIKSIPVVGVGSGVSGFESFVGADVGGLKQRYNPHLHRLEVRMVSVISRQHTYPQSGECDLFQWFTDKPGPDVIWKPGRNRKPVSLITRRWEPMDSFG